MLRICPISLKSQPVPLPLKLLPSLNSDNTVCPLQLKLKPAHTYPLESILLTLKSALYLPRIEPCSLLLHHNLELIISNTLKIHDLFFFFRPGTQCFFMTSLSRPICLLRVFNLFLPLLSNSSSSLFPYSSIPIFLPLLPVFPRSHFCDHLCTKVQTAPIFLT